MIRPDWLTVATFLLLVVYFGATFFPLYFAVRTFLLPMETDNDFLLKVSVGEEEDGLEPVLEEPLLSEELPFPGEETSFPEEGAVTVIVQLAFFAFQLVASITARPAFLAVSSPFLSTLTTEGSDDSQEKIAGEASVGTADTFKCLVSPIFIVRLLGSKEIDSTSLETVT